MVRPHPIVAVYAIRSRLWGELYGNVAARTWTMGLAPTTLQISLYVGSACTSQARGADEVLRQAVVFQGADE